MKLIALLVVLIVASIAVWQAVQRLRTPEQRAELEARLNAIGAGWLTRVRNRLATWKTVLLGFLGTAWMVLPDLLSELYNAPWTNWLDAGWARLIGALLYLSMILTRIHSPGPVGQAPVMPPGAPGNAVLVPQEVKAALVEEAKAEGKL